MWVEPKTDWGPDDFYNFNDLNRVEANTEYIAELIAHFGTPPTLVTVTDRDMKRIEFADSLNRIEGNIDALRQRYTPPGWEPNKLNWAPNDPFDYNDANRLERNLALLYAYYQGNVNAFRYCGMYTCGDGGV